MFIERGGAPPPMFVDTTPQPVPVGYETQTTEAYQVYDTTGPITDVPAWAFGTPNPASFLEQIGLRLINFGQPFEKAAFPAENAGTTGAPYTDNVGTTSAPPRAVPNNVLANIEEVNPGRLNSEGKTGIIVRVRKNNFFQNYFIKILANGEGLMENF